MDSQTYQSLSDPHLNVYFQNKRIRRHLIKARLINRRGEILPDKAQETTVMRQEKHKRAKRELSHKITDYIIEEERRRQAFLRNYYDSAMKRSRVQKIRDGKKRTGRSLSRRLDHARSRTPSPSEQPKTPPSHRSPRRAKSAHHPTINVKNQLAHRPVSGKKKANYDYCRVTMIYFGPPNEVDQNRSNRDEIMILQQHCGGENLPVFKGFVRPQETFTFDSRRHPDYPFALALYINGIFDSRISVCCEYKHKHNVRLGSRYGLFGIYDVQKSQPCRMCRFEEHKKRLFPPAVNTEKISSQRKPMLTTEFPLEILLRASTISSKQEKTPSKREMNRVSTVVQATGSPRRLSSSSVPNKNETNESDTTFEETKENQRTSAKASSRTSKDSRQSTSIQSFPDKLHHSSEPVLNRNNTDDSRSSSRSIEVIETSTSLTHEDVNQKNRRLSESSSRSSKGSQRSSSIKLFQEKGHHLSESDSTRRNTDDSRSSSTTIELAKTPILSRKEDSNAKNRHSSGPSSRTSKQSHQSSSIKPFQHEIYHSSEPGFNRKSSIDSRSSSSTVESFRAPIPVTHEDEKQRNERSLGSSSSTSKVSSSSSSISLGVTNNNDLRSSSSSSSFSLEKEDDQALVNATSATAQVDELLPRPPSRAATRSSSSSYSQNEMKKDSPERKYLSSPSSSESVQRNEVGEKEFINRNIDSSSSEEFRSESFSKRNHFNGTEEP